MIADIMLSAHALIQHLPTEEQEQRLAVVQEALCWLGTPYHHAGRVMGAGVDCGMLLAEVFERTGVLPHVAIEDYPNDRHMHMDTEHMRDLVAEHYHPVDAPLPGDIVLYRYGRAISHAAIVLAWPMIIHSYIHLGVVLDDGIGNQELRERQTGFWSHWGGA
jgi:cell wall-associated NlpC family hydrolase